jgi:hypothetical protein
VLRTSVRSLSLLLLLLIVGNLDGAMLRHPNDPVQTVRGATTFDINLGENWPWSPRPENVGLESRGLIALIDRRRIVALDARQDENPAPYSWNAILGLGPSLPIGPAQPITPHDPRNLTRISNARGTVSVQPCRGF